MKRFLSVVVLVASLRAQDKQRTLTTKQAETLALVAPPTLHAAQGRCCPDAHGHEVAAGPTVSRYTLIWVQVRCGCGSNAGQLIDNYTVNPDTGQIWEGLEEEGKPLTSKRLDALRKSMTRQNSQYRR